MTKEKLDALFNDMVMEAAQDIIETPDIPMAQAVEAGYRRIDQIKAIKESILAEYDSTADTLKHIKRVNELLLNAASELMLRAKLHDLSKLGDPEKALFDKMTPKLAAVEYDSEEYKQFLAELKPALDHHYAANSHHPEHYSNGIDGMNLFDLLEMLLDWKAASERHETGSMKKSLEINKDRFGISPQLHKVLENTAEFLRLN